MENSLKHENMPTLCRSTTLLAEATITKWRVMATIRQLLQLPTGGTSAFGNLRRVASFQPPPPPPATSGMHRYSGVTSCHCMGMNAQSGRFLLSFHSQGNVAQLMLLTNPLAFPETVQQTGQKHFMGEINNQPLGATQNSSSQQQAVGAQVSFLWEIRGTGSMRDNWSDGYGKYRDRRGTGSIGKGPKHLTTHISLPENNHPLSPPQARYQSLIPSHPAFPPPPTTTHTKQFPTHPKPHTTKEVVPVALEVKLAHSAVSCRARSRQQRF